VEAIFTSIDWLGPAGRYPGARLGQPWISRLNLLAITDGRPVLVSSGSAAAMALRPVFKPSHRNAAEAHRGWWTRPSALEWIGSSADRLESVGVGDPDASDHRASVTTTHAVAYP